MSACYVVLYTHVTCILQILTWVRMYSNYGNISHTSHCMLHLATDVLTTVISTNSITPDSEGTDHSTGILLLIPEWLILHDIVTIATSNTARTAALIKHTYQEGKSHRMIIGCCVYATGTFNQIPLCIIIIIMMLQYYYNNYSYYHWQY